MRAELYGGPLDGHLMELDDGKISLRVRPHPELGDFPHDFDALLQQPESYPVAVYRRTRQSRSSGERIFAYQEGQT